MGLFLVDESSSLDGDGLVVEVALVAPLDLFGLTLLEVFELFTFLDARGYSQDDCLWDLFGLQVLDRDLLGGCLRGGACLEGCGLLLLEELLGNLLIIDFLLLCLLLKAKGII